MPPHPLHPAIVHFPLVLAILLPLSVAGALWAIHQGSVPRGAWALPVLVAVALFVSSGVALLTGQSEEDRVEAVVPETALGEHQEAAERFLVLSGVLMLLAAAGLAPRNLGTSARLLTMVGSVALVAAGVQVGAAGGALVYEHGAASAYTGTRPDASGGELADPGGSRRQPNATPEGGEAREGREGREGH